MMDSPEILHINLQRTSHNPDGTPGLMRVNQWLFSTLEMPWIGNQPKISCIPAGNYIAKIGGAPTFPNSYLLKDVPDREGIVIHAGNFAGDKSRGYDSDTKGCILIGRAATLLNSKKVQQRAVILSRSTLKAFHEKTAGKIIVLHILNPVSIQVATQENKAT